MTKLIMDNFLEHGVTEEEVQCVVCADGAAILDKLAADRVAWGHGEVIVGQNYDRDLRNECRNPNSDFANLEEAQKQSVVDDELEEIHFHFLFIVNFVFTFIVFSFLFSFYFDFRFIFFVFSLSLSS